MRTFSYFWGETRDKMNLAGTALQAKPHHYVSHDVPRDRENVVAGLTPPG